MDFVKYRTSSLWSNGKKRFEKILLPIGNISWFSWKKTTHPVKSWQFCWWPFWDDYISDPFKGFQRWPPTFGNKMVTAWITWSFSFLVIGGRDFVYLLEGNIYLVYAANWVMIYYLPPFTRTWNISWHEKSKFVKQASPNWTKWHQRRIPKKRKGSSSNPITCFLRHSPISILQTSPNQAVGCFDFFLTSLEQRSTPHSMKYWLVHVPGSLFHCLWNNPHITG